MFNGVHLQINRVHIRYEEDYFNHHRPFSMGLCIDRISLGNATTHWKFHTTNGMQFSRVPNDYINKEFDIVRLRVYINTMSEMIIPTSLWEATRNERLQIFTAISASEVRKLMTM